MIDQIIKIIELVQSKIHDSSTMGFTSYNSPRELRGELDGYITQLKTNDLSCLEQLHKLFLPTCILQDLSIPNGWGDEYITIAEKFDKIYYSLKK